MQPMPPLPYITELQAGSYALDGCRLCPDRRIDFGHALTVLGTVISANHPDRVTVDAGFKAFATDRPFGPDVLDVPGARYGWAGDEFGYVFPITPRIARPWGSRPLSSLRTATRPSTCTTAFMCVMAMRVQEIGPLWTDIMPTEARSRTSLLKPTAVNSILAEVRALQAQGRQLVSLMRGEPDFRNAAAHRRSRASRA